jgi:hypothetical protein
MESIRTRCNRFSTSLFFNENIGWRRSGDRTGLQPNSLQTGNFTGKITVSASKATILERETAVPQALCGQFPKQTIREIFPKNREF